MLDAGRLNDLADYLVGGVEVLVRILLVWRPILRIWFSMKSSAVHRFLFSASSVLLLIMQKRSA